MKRIILLLLVGFLSLTAFMPAPQFQETTFTSGEWFKFRIHYGIFNASYATLEVKDARLNGKDMFHVKGYGESTGLLGMFFHVEDYYESYFNKNEVKPERFIRKIDEGGHTKNLQIDFFHEKKIAVVTDKKNNKVETVPVEPEAQDMVSAFYHLRNLVDHTTIKEGDEFVLPMFFDKENFDFKLKYLGKETVKSKYGKVRCLKFRPYVQAGRVFKEEESLTLWISDDLNKIPIKIQAKLAVGSLTADLDGYKGLKNPFMTIKN